MRRGLVEWEVSGGCEIFVYMAPLSLYFLG